MFRPRTTRTPRATALAGVGVLIAGLGTAALSASAAAAAEPVLAPGETASSGMELLVNLPKTGAFAPENAFNSDLAFQGDYAFAGNYNGFTVYDIKNPRKTTEVAQVVCPGSQNDITVHGDLLFLSVDSRRSDDSCDSKALTLSEASASGTGYWEGIRIFDISDVRNPRYVKAVETDCGSHTHTLAGERDGKAYLYVSSYDLPVIPAPPAQPTPLADCAPPHDKISVVEVPLAAPQDASVVAEPVLFPDGGYAGRPGGTGVPQQGQRATAGCHDITAYPEKRIAAGACMGEGVLLDIRDITRPQVTTTVRDTENFAFWHSATFDNDAAKVVFTDELGGGGGPTCDPGVGPTKGANAIYDIAGGQLRLASYYKIPREQARTENCVAHNGNLVPTRTGTDVMVQAWYQGGISVFDFTDSAAPRELAWFDRGPLSAERLVLGGSWSAYYHNGYVFSNDIQQGLDVFEIKNAEVSSARSIRQKVGDHNVQSQQSYKG